MKHGKIAGLKIKNWVNNSDHIMLLNNCENMDKFLGLSFKIEITDCNWPNNCNKIKPKIWKIAPRSSKMQHTFSIIFGNNLYHNITQMLILGMNFISRRRLGDYSKIDFWNILQGLANFATLLVKNQMIV